MQRGRFGTGGVVLTDTEASTAENEMCVRKINHLLSINQLKLEGL
jgi:hypothetical protein